MASYDDASNEVYMSVEEIEEELTVQRIMLSSMDDSCQNRDEAEAEVKAEIRELERQLRSLKQKKPTQNFTSHPIASANGTTLQDDPFAEDVFSYSTFRDPKIEVSSAQDSAPADSNRNSFLSPSKLSVRPQKRSHGEHLGSGDPVISDNKLRRTSPLSSFTRSTTPSSADYSDEDEKLRMYQMNREIRFKQEQDDEQLARRLQAEFSGGTSGAEGAAGGSSMSSQGPPIKRSPSAFDKILGRHNRSQPNICTGSQQHSQSAAAGPSFAPTLKIESPQSATGLRLAMPGAFNDSDDSDIEVISPSEFVSNGRQTGHSGMPSQMIPKFGMPSRSPYRPNFSDAADQARQAAFQRQQLGYSPSHSPGVFGAPTANSGMNPYGANLPGRPGYLHNGALMGANGSVYGNSLFGMNGNMLTNAGTYSFGGGVSNQDTLSRIVNRAGLNPDDLLDINGNHLSYRQAMDVADYINDPRKTEQEIKDLLENIRPDAEIPKEDREGTPEGLKYGLYEHQKLALTWLKSMETGKNKGGILADDMGLGKTISALALILSCPSANKSCKTTLVVGPVALIRQWEREIRTKIIQKHALSTFIYHGGQKTNWDTLRNYDVVLTTYGTIGAEFKRLVKFSQEAKGNPNFNESVRDLSCPFLAPKHKFYRVFLDEAQCIKNSKTMAAQAAACLQAEYRFCLTGTPMMNGVHELQSLIHFLRIKPYHERTEFTKAFGCLSKGTNESSHYRKNAMKRLQVVLKSIMLRRTKSSKIDGEPILVLPEKTEVIDHVLFNEDEQAYYTSLETKSRLQFNKYMKAGTIGKNYSNILVLLLRLRQAACHPHLIMDFDEAPEVELEDMLAIAKTISPDVVGRIKEANAQFECPVCYDPVPNPRIVLPCGHDTCRECLVQIMSNAGQQNIAAGDENSSSATCPTCRGKIDPKQIIDYESFKKVHMDDGSIDVDGNDSDGNDQEDSDELDTDDSETSSDEESINSDGNLDGFVVPDGIDEDGDDEEDEEDDDLDAIQPKGESTMTSTKRTKNETHDQIEDEAKAESDEDEDFPELDDIKVPDQKKRKTRATGMFSKATSSKEAKKFKKTKQRDPKGKGKGKQKEKVKHISLSMLKKEANKSAANRKKYMKYLRDNWVSSAKTEKCVEILRVREQGIKTIIFSQFTTLLDLVEVPVKREFGRCYVRYDGSMSANARNDAVVKFTEDARCTVMLVSLKAGNAGLNLVAASEVIILDPFWNPYIEMQAVDRAHRIGQQKPVTVHRILVEKTVEDRIMELQAQKRKLVDAALDEKASGKLGKLGQRELIFLFNGGEGQERQTAARPLIPGPSGYTNIYDESD